MWVALFYNNATVWVAFPTPLTWRFLLSAISFNGASGIWNRALWCFAHTITAGVTAAIMGAKTPHAYKMWSWAVVRESLRPIPSSYGEWQHSSSLLCWVIPASHLRFTAHTEISVACLSCTVSVLQPIHHLRGNGGQRVGKQTQTLNPHFMRCTRGWWQARRQQTCRELPRWTGVRGGSRRKQGSADGGNAAGEKGGQLGLLWMKLLS